MKAGGRRRPGACRAVPVRASVRRGGPGRRRWGVAVARVAAPARLCVPCVPVPVRGRAGLTPCPAWHAGRVARRHAPRAVARRAVPPARRSGTRQLARREPLARASAAPWATVPKAVRLAQPALARTSGGASWGGTAGAVPPARRVPGAPAAEVLPARRAAGGTRSAIAGTPPPGVVAPPGAAPVHGRDRHAGPGRPAGGVVPRDAPGPAGGRTCAATGTGRGRSRAAGLARASAGRSAPSRSRAASRGSGRSAGSCAAARHVPGGSCGASPRRDARRAAQPSTRWAGRRSLSVSSE